MKAILCQAVQPNPRSQSNSYTCFYSRDVSRADYIDITTRDLNAFFDFRQDKLQVFLNGEHPSKIWFDDVDLNCLKQHSNAVRLTIHCVQSLETTKAWIRDGYIKELNRRMTSKELTTFTTWGGDPLVLYNLLTKGINEASTEDVPDKSKLKEYLQLSMSFSGFCVISNNVDGIRNGERFPSKEHMYRRILDSLQLCLNLTPEEFRRIPKAVTDDSLKNIAAFYTVCKINEEEDILLYRQPWEDHHPFIAATNPEMTLLYNDAALNEELAQLWKRTCEIINAPEVPIDEAEEIVTTDVSVTGERKSDSPVDAGGGTGVESGAEDSRGVTPAAKAAQMYIDFYNDMLKNERPKSTISSRSTSASERNSAGSGAPQHTIGMHTAAGSMANTDYNSPIVDPHNEGGGGGGPGSMHTGAGGSQGVTLPQGGGTSFGDVSGMQYPDSMPGAGGNSHTSSYTYMQGGRFVDRPVAYKPSIRLSLGGDGLLPTHSQIQQQMQQPATSPGVVLGGMHPAAGGVPGGYSARGGMMGMPPYPGAGVDTGVESGHAASISDISTECLETNCFIAAELNKILCLSRDYLEGKNPVFSDYFQSKNFLPNTRHKMLDFINICNGLIVTYHNVMYHYCLPLPQEDYTDTMLPPKSYLEQLIQNAVNLFQGDVLINEAFHQLNKHYSLLPDHENIDKLLQRLKDTVQVLHNAYYRYVECKPPLLERTHLYPSYTTPIQTASSDAGGMHTATSVGVRGGMDHASVGYSARVGAPGSSVRNGMHPTAGGGYCPGFFNKKAVAHLGNRGNVDPGVSYPTSSVGVRGGMGHAGVGYGARVGASGVPARATLPSYPSQSGGFLCYNDPECYAPGYAPGINASNSSGGSHHSGLFGRHLRRGHPVATPDGAIKAGERMGIIPPQH